MSTVLDPPVVRLDASWNGQAMTPEEFDAVEEWDEAYEYELIRGTVIVNPIPAEGEVDPNGELEALFRAYQATHPQGNCLDKSLQERYVYLPDGSRRKADRLVWAGLERRPHPKRDIPTIIIEFVSKTSRGRRRDYVVKREEYLAIGVKEYWVINRIDHNMTVFRPDGSEVQIAEHDRYQTPILPGFELPLDRLFALSDQWEAETES